MNPFIPVSNSVTTVAHRVITKKIEEERKRKKKKKRGKGKGKKEGRSGVRGRDDVEPLREMTKEKRGGKKRKKEGERGKERKPCVRSDRSGSCSVGLTRAVTHRRPMEGERKPEKKKKKREAGRKSSCPRLAISEESRGWRTLAAGRATSAKSHKVRRRGKRGKKGKEGRENWE